MPAKNERRRHTRHDIRFPLKIRHLHTTPPQYKGAQVKNFSEGGLLINADEFLSYDSGLILEFSLPGDPKPIRAISRVAWVKKLPISENYEIGGEFIEITKKEKALISDFLLSH